MVGYTLKDTKQDLHSSELEEAFYHSFRETARLARELGVASASDHTVEGQRFDLYDTGICQCYGCLPNSWVDQTLACAVCKRLF